MMPQVWVHDPSLIPLRAKMHVTGQVMPTVTPFSTPLRPPKVPPADTTAPIINAAGGWSQRPALMVELVAITK